MSLKSRIVDPGNGLTANVVKNDATDKNGLVVLTEQFLSFNPSFVPFINETQGTAMNIDGSYGGTPIGVHDGTDSALWTGSNIVGTSVTFDSTNRPQAGTKSVEVLGPTLLDVWEFDKGSNQDLSSYTAITFYVNVDRRWTTDSVEIYGWDGTAEVGARVKIEDYFNENEFDTWQVVAIPLVDMNLAAATVQAFRMQYVTKAGASVEFYIDEFQIEETSGAIEYTAMAPTVKPYRAHKFLITMSDALDPTLLNSNMHGLNPNALLGVSALTNGLLISRFEDGIATFSVPFRDLEDFLATGYEIKSAVSDGTNTTIVLEVEFQDPLIIQGADTENYLSIVVRDNLSDLTRLSAVLRGVTEV